MVDVLVNLAAADAPVSVDTGASAASRLIWFCMFSVRHLFEILQYVGWGGKDMLSHI